MAVLESSTANLFGTDFVLDGAPLTDLVAGEAFIINERDVTLTGALFEDGSAFSFDLNQAFLNSSNDQVDPSSTLTVTLTAVPEPSSIAILLFGCGLAGLRRTRSAA